MSLARINSKRKGKAGELEACQFLERHDIEASRSQQYKGNVNAADLDVPYFEDMGLHIEIKRCQERPLQKWIEQAQADIAGEGNEYDVATMPSPLLMHRRNREDWKITMDASDFIELTIRLFNPEASVQRMLVNKDNAK